MFYTQLQELLQFEAVRSMDQFPQHGSTSCLTHSIAVAYYSLAFFRRLYPKKSAVALLRGAMLHDLFLYDWHVPHESHRLHGLFHPRTSLNNASRLFPIGKVERDIILRHMWPLTLIPPRTAEAWIVCLVDKGCSLVETIAHKRGRQPYTAILDGLRAPLPLEQGARAE